MASRYEYYNTPQDDMNQVYGTEGGGSSILVGQSFTPQTAHKITSVKVQIKKRGSASGTLYCYVKAVDGDGYPTGSVLASGSIAISGVGTDFAWHEISLGAGVNLAADTMYCFYLVAPSCTSANEVLWGMDYGNATYAGGELFRNINNAGWNDEPTWDNMFEEWGEEIVLPPAKSFGFIF